jgi:phosphoglycolate phosphatase
MTYTAALFDLDGTLLDTLDDLADSMNAALAAFGYPAHPLEAHRYFVGDGVFVYAERALPAYVRGDQAVVAACAARMREEYASRWKAKTRLYDGIAELLDQLTARGIGMAILSNKPHPAVVDVVGHFFGRWRFAAALGAQPSAPKKPDPAVALEIARTMGAGPEACIYVGDTDTDMQTAQRAGMYAVGALWGFRTREELVRSGAKTLVSHPLEILDLL